MSRVCGTLEGSGKHRSHGLERDSKMRLLKTHSHTSNLGGYEVSGEKCDSKKPEIDQYPAACSSIPALYPGDGQEVAYCRIDGIFQFFRDRRTAKYHRCCNICSIDGIVQFFRDRRTAKYHRCCNICSIDGSVQFFRDRRTAKYHRCCNI